MNALARGWRFLIEVYLGDHGFRTALVVYAVGFWIFLAGGVIYLIHPDNPPSPVAFARALLLVTGLMLVVFMTYPIIRCSFRRTDPTRPASQFLRVMLPVVIGALSPFYLMLLVVSFLYLIVAPAMTG